ncbi:MAG: DUF4011 domain-containing protein [Clostridia bacterium]|nr:DUF4011 domain-containing protein [Clostridia bacterium]
MAQKSKKLEECLELNVEAPKVLSYADYYMQNPLFTSLQIKNSSIAAIEGLTLAVSNGNGLVTAHSKQLEEIPFESKVAVALPNIISPLYFVNLEEVKEEEIFIELFKDKKLIIKTSVKLTVLPFDFWEGVNGNVERLAGFIRPKLADCAKLRADVQAQLRKWEVFSDLEGYEGADKNTILRTIAGLYAVMRRVSVEREEVDMASPVQIEITKFLTKRKASPLEMAIFVCSTLESFGLHPVLAIGEKELGVGVWLHDSCFMDTTSDDLNRLEKYVSEGINSLSCFDVEDLFSDKNAAYATSEKHFLQKLNEGKYYCYIDVRRLRIARVTPLPIRTGNAKRYEVLSEADISLDNAPKTLTEQKNLAIFGKQTKDKQWERRLLDLSLKNTLLNFQPHKNCVHVASVSPDAFYETVKEGKEFSLMPVNTEFETVTVKRMYYGADSETRKLNQLIELEQGSGVLRSFARLGDLNEACTRLIRKNKESDEESGAKILYLAIGFLKWYSREDGKEKYAPLVLQPITLKKRKSGDFAFSVTDDDLSVNFTLLEFLKQEFNIDIRALDLAAKDMKISEILNIFRIEVGKMKDWKVYDDVYVSAFSFARYQMWQDLRKNMEEFSKNALISSLLHNRSELSEQGDENIREDACSPLATLAPLTADTTQWEAIALSQTGKTFVLHGPPGTGKSQTITNIIANALNDGKRVLFVAEKQAALSVVKKRLDGLGLGDFCLELHANKTSKADVLQKLTSTVALANAQESVGLMETSDEIVRLKKELDDPVVALHKKRRLGVSVYEALLICLKNKSAPEIMNIESAFYDRLTKEKISSYKTMMIEAAAAAKECGGVCNSPFENVNLTEYSLEVRDSVYCSSEVVIAEIKHLKSYIGLLLELYRQRISTLTRKKLDGLYQIAKILASGGLNKYFKSNEEQFYAFFNANRRLDKCFENYFKRYKKLVDISKEYKELNKWLEDGNVDYTSIKLVHGVAKRLSKQALTEDASPEIILKDIETLTEIYKAMEVIRSNTDLSSYFTMAFGRVDFFEPRKNFLSDLYKIHELCADVFMDYNPDSFNSMCIRASNGYTTPVLQGLIRSIESFRASERSFLEITKGDARKVLDEEVLDYYYTKASSLIDNIDMLANWCMYKKRAMLMNKEGLTFITDALEDGSITSENVVDSFEKNIYKNFLQTNVPLDPVLSHFSATLLEENTESLRKTMDEFARLTREKIRSKLISRIPTPSTEGALSLELINFQRLAKTNLRGMGLRKLFEEIPELIKVIAPCMLMSPITVAQYLKAENGLFDLVIFDEASQMPTAEAIGSLARAKSAIVVGDPKQLPPTAFFNANYVDEDNLENEDMESVLDDCLALGVPERHLSWHYRSKHESLIAFSNIMYYGNKLCTFPSPDSLSSKVVFNLVDGIYDRGFTKHNKAEADALIAEVIARLSDPMRSKSSMGIVTFSSVQKDYIERRLTAAIAEKHLDDVAYDREEPLFVKNLENVQGDERDVIFFSVCYGPDKNGRMSLNFGPLNQAGGWRRLNVAVSRAREEMCVFSSITAAMIDLSKTDSKGVAGLKAFLEFAQKGRTTLAIPSGNLTNKKAGIGKYIAEELSSYGYDCRYDVGVSDFKIDVAVVDPKNKHRFILAIMCDTPTSFSIKDRNVLQIQTLKRNNWNVTRVYAINYYNNPKREIKRIKDLLDRLTGADKKGGNNLLRAKRPYKVAKLDGRVENATFVTSGENDAEITSRLKALVAAEEPISYAFLVKRCLTSLGILKYGAKVEARMQALVALCGFKTEKLLGTVYYRKTDKFNSLDKYRVENGEVLRKTETDFTPYEILAMIRGALEDKVALYVDEIVTLCASILRLSKPTEKFALFINDCISLGEDKGLFVRSVSDRITLA